MLTPNPGRGPPRPRPKTKDDAEAEDADLRQDITDRASGLSVLSERCSTCILRQMHLGPEQTAAFVRQVLAEGTYVVCASTPDYGPAICRGFFEAYPAGHPR